MPSLSAATVTPARHVRGRISVPGDKSISHRYALIGALADGATRLSNFAPGGDCQSTLSCLSALGIEVRRRMADEVTIVGRGLRQFHPPARPLDAGNSGTTMRMLAGVLAAQPFSSIIAGDASLSRRPMGRVIGPLRAMGARIDATDGHAPLIVHGSGLHAISHRPDVPSAQVKSAVLFAGLHAEGTTSVTERVQTRDHTERALAAFEFDVRVDGPTVSIDGGQRGAAQTLHVPGDFSSAAFWMAAAASLPGSRIQIDGVGLNPTRVAFLGVLGRFGARVDVIDASESAGERFGTIIVEGDRAGAVVIAPDEVPALIDELPAIAALAACGGQVSVGGAAELRVKESDRIATLVAGFRALGIDADERADGFVIHGAGAPPGGVADAQGDHRMAMAFAIAALGARQPSRIEGSDAVGISYPGFFETLGQLVV